jgi:site-specific DNA-cytosine methylase
VDIPRLNALDLFSGIGGNTLALREYCKVIAYCEADKHAQSVLLSRMADGSIEHAPICTDVKLLTRKEFEGIRVDIIIAGFP